MFYYISGKVAAAEAGLVVIDAGGVGYAINTSYLSARSVKVGEQALFYTFLRVAENIFELYGFIRREELDCFKQLVAISGVGPRAALAILGTVTPEKLALCVISGDEKALTAAPGVGKKLAQRILLELKDKMSRGAAWSCPRPGTGPLPWRMRWRRWPFWVIPARRPWRRWPA